MTRMRRHSTQFGFLQTGLSLIELMIAMAVGLILIAGVLSIFISSRQSYGINGAVGQIQENGRFALDFIRTAARKAGYMGCATSALTVSYLMPAADPTAYNFSQPLYGFGYAAVPPAPAENPAPDPVGTNWAPGLDAFLTGKVLPNTDVLVVRFTQRNPIYITNIASAGAVVATVNTLGLPDQPDLAPGNLFVASNCVNAIVMQATALTAGPALEYTAPGEVPGNTPGQVLPQSFIGAAVVSPTTAVFFVGVGADGSPALFEANTDTTGAGGVGGNGFMAAAELVPGVENMRVLYGVDLTGSQVPSEYDTAGAVTTAGLWGSVVSVRVALLLRSNIGAVPLPAAAPTYTLVDNTITAPQDTRLRQVFTATIGLRNSLP